MRPAVRLAVLGVVLPQLASAILARQGRVSGEERATEAPPSYFWSSGRGSMGSYGASPFAATLDIQKPTWTWHHSANKWSTIPIGAAIDDQKNIYLTAADGVRKFRPDGNLSWTYEHKQINRQYEVITKVAAIMDGGVYGITSAGRVFGLRMDTGEELWSTKVAKDSDGNYGHVVANHGVVITAAEVSMDTKRKTPSCCGSMNHKVVGLSGKTGEVLWEYRPEIPIWNFGSAFAGDGTFVFQDLEGRVHRNRVSDGALLWKAGGVPESWTDGQANLGSNGIVYGVSNYGLQGPTGCISAYNLSDGALLWRRDLPKSPNSVPAVGRLAGRGSPSVVIPVGENDRAGAQIDVYAFDAATGEKQWVFEGPTQTVSMGLGDVPGLHTLARAANHVQTFTLPNSWGCAAIDGAGTVYVGGTTGHLYGLRDLNADGKVIGGAEVSTLTTDADFVGSSGPAFAPGLMAVGNANSLFVWTY